jgi:hypothetical protein
MGFMDKAKQAAQRAQQVLDEQQNKFNQAQSQRTQPGSGGTGVTYDQHGRPIEQPTPPPATPGGDQGPSARGEEPDPAAGSEGTDTRPPRDDPPRDDLNSTPDSFKPIGG